MSLSKKIIIVGSGPCGLGAAWRTEELLRYGSHNVDWILVEGSVSVGGLATSVTDTNGFLWDLGGHVVFSHYDYFTKVLDSVLSPDEWNHKVRESWIWMRNRFIPYPLQHNIHHLPQDEIIACVNGLLDRRQDSRPGTFADWLSQSFGDGLCETFMTPYNRKVWGYAPEKLAPDWIAERVATVDVRKVIAQVISGTDSVNWGPNNIFRYPLRGGTGSIWKRVYETLPREKVLFQRNVSKINVTERTVTFDDGSSEEYDAVVSTMPLDLLCGIVEGTRHVPSDKFLYSSSHIVGFGIEGQTPEHLASKCWIYFPEDNCPFYRVTVFSNYSPYHVPIPNKQWSLLCETAESPDKPVDKIIANTEQGLYNTKLIDSEAKIISRFHVRIEHGYPTPFLGRDEICKPIFEDLESHNVYSRGRFGAWKYEVSNQDHSFMMGVEAIDRIVLGTDELTFQYPSAIAKQ